MKAETINVDDAVIDESAIDAFLEEEKVCQVQLGNYMLALNLYEAKCEHSESMKNTAKSDINS